MTPQSHLKILHLEDNPDDAELVENELVMAGLNANIVLVDDRERYLRELDGDPDVILADFSLPQFDAIEALQIARDSRKTTPFIIVSGVLTDETASDALRQGAWDFLLKDRLARLGPAVRHALDERKLRREKEATQARLEHVNSRLESALSQLQMTHQEMEEAHEKLKENQTQLIHAEKMSSLGQLTAGIAHEINNPIGFIRSNLDRLMDYVGVMNRVFDAYKPLEETAQKNEELAKLLHGLEQIRSERNVEMIREDLHLLIEESASGIEQIAEIVTGLKNFSRVDELELQPADVNDGIRAALRLLSNELKYRFTVQTDLQPLPRILCHPGQLNQVFINLIINAIQATPDRGEISVSSQALDGFVELRFADTGKGIDPDVLPHIFDPFYTTKPVGEGTGLGLSISYGIINRHEGRLEVDSKPGEGTTFIIKLPIRLEHEC